MALTIPTFFNETVMPWIVSPQAEGGYSDDPSDRGGCTMNGITQNTYSAWLAANGQPVQAVRMIPSSIVALIYKGEYWDKIDGDTLPPTVGLVAFDGAVQHGPEKSIKLLQTALGFPADQVDGDLGPVTISAITVADTPSLVAGYLAARKAFYNSIVAAVPSQMVFYNGWMNRLTALAALVATVGT